MKRVFEDAANDPVHCDLRYQGQLEDKESGLYYNLNRYYDADSGQYLSSDPIGMLGGLRPQAYVHNPMEWVDPLGFVGNNVFIHYTDADGYNKIMNSGVIKANTQGKVYVTDLLLTPEDVERDLLIINPKYAGRGEYAIIFKVNEHQMMNINQSSLLEYIHSGQINLDESEILFSGKNPYSVLSNLSYKERLNLTHEQIDNRNKSCG